MSWIDRHGDDDDMPPWADVLIAVVILAIANGTTAVLGVHSFADQVLVFPVAGVLVGLVLRLVAPRPDNQPHRPLTTDH